MADVQIRPHHCGISVSDLDGAVAWFEKVLDFTLDKTGELPGCRLAFVKNGDFSVELFQHDETRPASPERSLPNEDIKTQGNKHMCLIVNDLDALLARFEENDVEVVLGPFVAPDGYRACFIHGPDQALMEFIQAPRS